MVQKKKWKKREKKTYDIKVTKEAEGGRKGKRERERQRRRREEGKGKGVLQGIDRLGYTLPAIPGR